MHHRINCSVTAVKTTWRPKPWESWSVENSMFYNFIQRGKITDNICILYVMISIVFIRCTLFLFEETDMGSVAKKVFYNNLKGSDPGTHSLDSHIFILWTKSNHFNSMLNFIAMFWTIFCHSTYVSNIAMLMNSVVKTLRSGHPILHPCQVTV